MAGTQFRHLFLYLTNNVRVLRMIVVLRDSTMLATSVHSKCQTRLMGIVSIEFVQLNS